MPRNGWLENQRVDASIADLESLSRNLLKDRGGIGLDHGSSHLRMQISIPQRKSQRPFSKSIELPSQVGEKFRRESAVGRYVLREFNPNGPTSGSTGSVTLGHTRRHRRFDERFLFPIPFEWIDLANVQVRGCKPGNHLDRIKALQRPALTKNRRPARLRLMSCGPSFSLGRERDWVRKQRGKRLRRRPLHRQQSVSSLSTSRCV